MPFYQPRHHRRRLLLPPGWVALAGLLLLGCLAIRSWQERLKLRYALQLTMPRLRLQHDGLDNLLAFSPEKLTEFHEWYDTYFDGNFTGDARRAYCIARQAAAMRAAPERDQRLRVKLGPQATYAQMIFLLNTMHQFGIKKYVFNSRHKHVTFYAFTVSPLAHRRHPPMLAVRETYYQAPIMSYPTHDEQTAGYRTRLRHWQDALRTYQYSHQ